MKKHWNEIRDFNTQRQGRRLCRAVATFDPIAERVFEKGRAFRPLSINVFGSKSVKVATVSLKDADKIMKDYDKNGRR